MAVGKNFLENLTVAMYENSFAVYREYIQNSADSIDAALRTGLLAKEDAIIDIHIEYGKRRITVYDNACGISMRDFKKKMMDVADSDKDRDVEKGFRGIGRLAGLGYCDRLSFRTSAKGENKVSTIAWDGIKLRNIVNDQSQHPTSDELIDVITDISYESTDEDSHFFEVTMEDVIFESDDLLEEAEVSRYLRMTAPVPYENHFMFSNRIHQYAAEHGFRIDEYNVCVNGNQIFKPYTYKLYEGTSEAKTLYDEIDDVQFRIFSDEAGSPVAWLWYGVSKYEKNIPVINQMRCIRLRKDNIQIGDEYTVSKYFKESRGNAYFVGELYALDKNLIPNARRDYFNPSPATQQLENLTHEFFYTELYNLYHYASKLRSAQRTLATYRKKENEYVSKLSNAGFIDESEKQAAEKEIEDDRARVQKAEREIANRKKDTESNDVYGQVFTAIEKAYAPEDDEAVQTSLQELQEQNKGKHKYLTQTLSSFSKKEQKLISRIYGIIKSILPPDMADPIIKRIQENLKQVRQVT